MALKMFTHLLVKVGKKERPISGECKLESEFAIQLNAASANTSDIDLSDLGVTDTPVWDPSPFITSMSLCSPKTHWLDYLLPLSMNDYKLTFQLSFFGLSSTPFYLPFKYNLFAMCKMTDL